MRERDKPYVEVKDADSFTERITHFDVERHEFNHKVMVALIESGGIKRLLLSDGNSKVKLDFNNSHLSTV